MSEKIRVATDISLSQHERLKAICQNKKITLKNLLIGMIEIGIEVEEDMMLDFIQQDTISGC